MTFSFVGRPAEYDDRPDHRISPGKVSLTSRMWPRLESVQRKASAATAQSDTRAPQADHAIWGLVTGTASAAQYANADDILGTAAAGVSGGGGGALPHLDTIQRAFGHHDVGGVRAHVGGAAADASAAIGARAYATGDDVAFASSPDLHTTAHEAAHVVQQRGGVRLAGGVGQAGDPYERHADAVAELVVRGDSAEALLDSMAHRGAGGGPAVQRDDDGATSSQPLRADLQQVLARVTDPAALQQTRDAIGAVLATAAPTQTYGIVIGGAEYGVPGAQLRPLLAATEQRAIALTTLDHHLAASSHATPLADPTRPPEAEPETHAVGSIEIIDHEFTSPLGSFTLHLSLAPHEEPAAGGEGEGEGEVEHGVGGDVAIGRHGPAGGVEFAGALHDLLYPDCEHAAQSVTLIDRAALEGDHEGIHAVYGLVTPPAHFGPVQIHFSFDLIEVTAGEHGVRISGPSLTAHFEIPVGPLWDLIPADVRSRFSGSTSLRGAQIEAEMQWEPPWRDIVEDLGLSIDGAAAAAPVAEEIAGFSTEEIGTMLVLAAPELLIGACLVAPVVAIAYLASTEDTWREDVGDVPDRGPRIPQDPGLTQLGSTFSTAVHDFAAGYTAALRGQAAPDGDSGDRGHRAGLTQVQALVHAGHSEADVHATAVAARDLRHRVDDANRGGYEAQAHFLADEIARAGAARGEDSAVLHDWAGTYLVQVADGNYHPAPPRPHSHAAPSTETTTGSSAAPPPRDRSHDASTLGRLERLRAESGAAPID